MPFKYDANGNIVVQEVGGAKLPVFVHGDGREAPFDADATAATISRLNGEAKTHREAKEAAEARLKAFEGIDDGEAARKALETVKNLSTGDLKTAAQVQEIKDAAAQSAKQAVADATRAAEAREKALAEQNAKLTADLIEATAIELEDDLGAGMVGGYGSAGGSRLTAETESQIEALEKRIDELERSMARRERAFTRLMDFLAELTGPRR